MGFIVGSTKIFERIDIDSGWIRIDDRDRFLKSGKKEMENWIWSLNLSPVVVVFD